jgi:hypothetical protein
MTDPRWHLTGPYFVVRVWALVPSITLGSWVVAASNVVLHASLSSAFFSLRQVVISSALGMNVLQSLTAQRQQLGDASTSGEAALTSTIRTNGNRVLAQFLFPSAIL